MISGEGMHQKNQMGLVEHGRSPVATALYRCSRRI